MKRFILTLLCFLVFCVNVQAQMLIGNVCGGASTAACENVYTNATGGVAQNISYGATAELFVASSFVAATSGDIKTLYIDIKDGGTPSSLPANLLAYLCSDNAGVPNSGTAMASCTQSTTINITDPGSTYIQAKWKFAGYPVTNGVTYWVVLTSSYGSNSSTVYFVADSDSSSIVGAVYDSPEGTDWTVIDATRQLKMTLTTCDE